MGKVITQSDFKRMCEENQVIPQSYFSGIYDRRGHSIRYKFKCRQCDTEFYSSIYDDHIKVCPYCKSHEMRSQRERQLVQYIQSLGYQVEVSNKTILDGFEIDIYVPSCSIGFEVNGLVFHSSDCNHSLPVKPKASDYHLKKTLLALSKGVYLYHLWDYESIESQKLLIREVLQGQLQLTTWVDRNPSLAPQAELKPLYYVTKDISPYKEGLHLSKPRSWNNSSIIMYEFYNAGFAKL